MIVWVDTETTVLDPERGDLLEVALVVTTDNLIEFASTTTVVQPIAPLGIKVWMEHIDPRIREMHGKNGLLDEIVAGRGTNRAMTEAVICAWAHNVVRDVVAAFKAPAPDGSADAEMMKAFLSGDSTAVLKKTPLAGSTVGFARAWIRRHMPALESLFHYRSIDVSSLTELAQRWAPAVYEGRPKGSAAHRALANVRESIACLRYYRECGFVGGISCEQSVLRDEIRALAKSYRNAFYEKPTLTEIADELEELLAMKTKEVK